MATAGPMLLSAQQQQAFEQIRDFMSSTDHAFILKGYAGTGKTTLIRNIVQWLQRENHNLLLAAPTGRAAKILGQQTGVKAHTLHSKIYNFDKIVPVNTDQGKNASDDESEAEVLKYLFDVKELMDVSNTVLIVDEASMISDRQIESEYFQFGSGKLLHDIIKFIKFSTNAHGNKVIFVGDPAQLPPPTSEGFSPALDAEYLEEKYKLCTQAFTLTHVFRQTGDSDILDFATNLRKKIDSGCYNYFSTIGYSKNIHEIQYSDFLEQYKAVGDKKIVVAYSNNTAQGLNQIIRFDKYGIDPAVNPVLPPQLGDIMIVSKNNRLAGLYNGDLCVINHLDEQPITRTVHVKAKNQQAIQVDLTWQLVELAFYNTEGTRASVTMYMLENFLYGGTQLSKNEFIALLVDFKRRHPELRRNSEEFKNTLANDPFFNALCLKYGYAITCHKAQGGEWDTVFVAWDYAVNSGDWWTCPIDHPGRDNETFFRWAYTAITRASNTLFTCHTPHFTPYKDLFLVSSPAQEALRQLDGDQGISFTPDASLQALLERFGVEREHTRVQHHFLAMAHQAQTLGIEAIGWQRKAYEILYHFKKGEETAGIKGWVNGQDIFKDTIQKIPKLTSSEELFGQLAECWQKVKHFQLVQTNPSHAEQHAPQEWTGLEAMPFLQELYDDMQPMIQDAAVKVVNIEHLPYKERYVLEWNTQPTVVDFSYNKKGFFGRVEIIPNPTPQAPVVELINQIVNHLKTPNHVH